MSSDAAIVVNNVSKEFLLPHERTQSIKSAFVSQLRGKSNRTKERQHALNDISFEVNKGEFFGIVGRNGSGKSTLLKIIAQIYQPTKGSATVSGRLVPFIELGVGFNPELTGRDNVYLSGSLMGFSEKEIDRMYEDIVEFAELGKFMDQKLKNYSSGMQVRLAFSVAIKADADVLLIDEVLAVGDEEFQRKCFDYFRKLKKDKKTVIFVSHNMDAINEFCDRALLIEKSHVKDVGDTRDIAKQYSKLFLDDKNKDKHLNQLVTEKRSGTGVMRIDNAVLNKSVFTNQDKEIRLAVDLKCLEKNEHLMTGFAVKDPKGQFINNTHSWDRRKVVAELEPGQEAQIVWTFPNIYEDGLYTVDVYVHGKGNEVYDRIEEAVSFRVKRPAKSGGLVVVEPDLQVNASHEKNS